MPVINFMYIGWRAAWFGSLIVYFRRQQEAESSDGVRPGSGAPPLVSELRALRARKDELEGHLSSLQESRKHLMQQLEGLMRMLKVGTLTLERGLRSAGGECSQSIVCGPFPYVSHHFAVIGPTSQLTCYSRPGRYNCLLLSLIINKIHSFAVRVII